MRPTSVIIGPFNYKIFYSAEDLQALHRAGAEDMLGATKPDIQEIVIADRRPEQAIRDTLLHEILHVVIHTFSIQVPAHMKEEDPGEREEMLVSQISSPLLDVIQRNHRVMKYLLESGDVELEGVREEE